jgi:hypothetical protein
MSNRFAWQSRYRFYVSENIVSHILTAAALAAMLIMDDPSTDDPFLHIESFAKNYTPGILNKDIY